MKVFVYLIENKEGKIYVGVSKDPEKRLKEHNSRRGSIFTKKGNFKIIFIEEYETLKDARKREIQIKKWSRVKKLDLIKKYKEGLNTKVL